MRKLGGMLFGLFLLVIVIGLIIGFIAKFGLIIVGIVLLVIGLSKLQKDKENGIKRKLPATLAIMGLVIGLSGIGVAFAVSPTDDALKTEPVHKTQEIPKKTVSETTTTSDTTDSPKTTEQSDDKNSTVASTTTSTSTTSTNTTSTDTTSSSVSTQDNSTATIVGLTAAVVSKNVDGDTLHVTLNGKDETIRMLLIDTPEDQDPRKPVEPFGYKAADYAKSVLPVGKHIYLQIGKKGYERDKYGRLLAYIYLSKTDMYNYDVIKKGLARVAYIYPPNTDHLSDLQAAQSYAKSHKLGIWSLAGFVDSDGYDLGVSCSYAKNNGYSTRGCSSGTTTTTTTTTTGSGSGGGTTSTPTSISGSSLNVAQGQIASVTITTKPGAKGTIQVIYNSGPSTAAGLGPKTADSSGKISWSWKVGSRTTPGNYQVNISVNGKTINKTLTVRDN